jgi:uncharacterized protein YxeA
VKNLLYPVLALISAIIAGYFLYSFQHDRADNTSSLVIGIIFAIAAVIFGGLFMFSKVNQHDEIYTR